MKYLRVHALLFLMLLSVFSIQYATNNMSVIAAFEGEHFTSGYGTSIASLDFNHDGYEDLIVAALFFGYASGQSASRGKVYLYYGGPSFSSNTPASITLEGNFNGTSGRQILTVHNVGDVNGDGFDDLCVYDDAPRYEADQRLMIFYGGTMNLDTPDLIRYYPYTTNVTYITRVQDVDGDDL